MKMCEMVSVPRELAKQAAHWLEVHCDGPSVERGVAEDLRAALAAEQHQGEPVALPVDWQDQLMAEMSRRFELSKLDDYRMVIDDTQIGVEFAADWVCQRLSTHADPGEVELKQCEAMAAMVEEREWAEHVGTGPVSSRVEVAFTQLHNELSDERELSDTLRAKLAELEALLRLMRDGDGYLEQEDWDRIDAILSASAEPSALVEKGYSEIRKQHYEEFMRRKEVRVTIERKQEFRDHLAKCSEEVATWPAWKREVLKHP